MSTPGFYPKPTILVVDDSPDTRAIIKATLSAGGFEPLVARDGSEALRLLDSMLPDVVLLDVIMEGIGGFEVCQRLRASARTHSLPVIMMSSLAERDVVARAFAVGAVDFLAKPFRGEELCARVAVHAELGRARRELEESHARLAELNAEKDQMFGVAAHDLRGPLAAILGFADHALSAPAHPEAVLERHALEVVRREARQMNHYLEELLDLNALERGGVRMRPRALELGEVVLAAIDRHGPIAAQKNISLRLDERSIDACWHVRADPTFLRQILDNYLSNALKFTPPGGSVCVRLGVREGEVDVMVNDTGPGLNSSDMATVFTRFARLSARPTAGEKSTGLGLAICRALATRMGGRVWCGNHPGGGACFGLALPGCPSDSAALPALDGSVPITHPAIARDIAINSVPPFAAVASSLAPAPALCPAGL